MFANVTPIGPPEKCKVAIHAIQTAFVDPINVGSIVGNLLPLLFLLRIENRKRVKMYHFYQSLYLYMMTSKNTEVMFI